MKVARWLWRYALVLPSIINITPGRSHNVAPKTDVSSRLGLSWSVVDDVTRPVAARVWLYSGFSA